MWLLNLRMPLQILIELETALLDDEPHWYKLQTHDESSLPLPQPSPFMPRRHVHGESSSKKLQSRLKVFLVTKINYVVMRLNFKIFSQMPIRDQSIGKVFIYVKGPGKTILYIFPMIMIYSKQSNSTAES